MPSGTPLRISILKFRAGPSPNSPPLLIQPANVVLFVGPNNSGKSLALREIETWCVGQTTTQKVIAGIDVEVPSDADGALDLLRKLQTSPPPEHATPASSLWIGMHTFRSDTEFRHQAVDEGAVRSWFAGNNPQEFARKFLPFYTVRLDGRTRFNLTDPKGTGDLQGVPRNHLWALFVNDDARDSVRTSTEEAFALHFVIDPTAMQTFRIRMSLRAPADPEEEQALDKRSRAFHAQATPIEELSDGVKAFVGLVAAVHSLPHQIMLVDEPEAFLHPPLARRLGSSLAKLSHERGASLIAATHSSEFVFGYLFTALIPPRRTFCWPARLQGLEARLVMV